MMHPLRSGRFGWPFSSLGASPASLPAVFRTSTASPTNGASISRSLRAKSTDWASPLRRVLRSLALFVLPQELEQLHVTHDPNAVLRAIGLHVGVLQVPVPRAE